MPTSNVMSFFFRHAVALLVSYRHRIDDPHAKRRLAPFSCSVIVLDDIPCLLTAGHCIKKIEELIESHEITDISCAIGDIFGHGVKSNIPIPFDLINSPRFYIDKNEDELDFGAILLHPNHVRLLEANGIKGIFEENWAKIDEKNLDTFFILGFPEELAEKELTEDDHALVNPFLLKVEKPGDDIDPSLISDRRFVGVINGELSVASIKGMSGGPIIGLSRSNPNVYWIVAIQSGWLSSKRIVYGCPIPRIGRYLTNALRAARASLETANDV